MFLHLMVLDGFGMADGSLLVVLVVLNSNSWYGSLHVPQVYPAVKPLSNGSQEIHGPCKKNARTPKINQTRQLATNHWKRPGLTTKKDTAMFGNFSNRI